MGSLFRGITAATLAALLLGSLAATTVLARATTFTSPIIADVTGEVVEGCSELIVLSGVLHDVLHVTERADGSVTFAVTSNPGGLYGTGVDTGGIYRATGATHLTVVSGALDETTTPERETVTLIDRTRIVGTGGEMTLDIWLTFHVTTLDGVDVVRFERAKVTCS